MRLYKIEFDNIYIMPNIKMQHKTPGQLRVMEGQKCLNITNGIKNLSIYTLITSNYFLYHIKASRLFTLVVFQIYSNLKIG